MRLMSMGPTETAKFERRALTALRPKACAAIAPIAVRRSAPHRANRFSPDDTREFGRVAGVEAVSRAGPHLAQ